VSGNRLTLIDLLRAREGSRAPVAYFYRGFELEESLSGGEILRRARAVASSLPEPEQPSECLLLSAPNGPGFVAAYFGALLRGYVPTPLPMAGLLKPRDLVELLARVREVSRARIILTEGEGLRSAREAGIPHAIDLKSLPREESAFREASPGPDSPCLVQFSSGSTGSPRGVVLTHSAVLANLKAIRLGMRSSPADVGCSWLPFYHDMGWIGGFLSPLEAGYPVHLLAPFDFVASPGKWLKLAEDVKATLILGPDFAYRYCVRHVPREMASKLNLGRVRLALSGAEPVHGATCRKFAEHFSAAGFRAEAFFPVYGLAENALAVAFPEPGTGARSWHLGRAELISCGKPLPGTEVRIAGPDGGALPETEIGRILLRSPSLCRGYLGDEEATRALFQDGWLVTGDLGCLRNGELHVAGREKDLIILNGRKFHAVDIERRGAEVTGFHFGRSAAVGLPGPEGEVLAFVAECRELLPWRRRRLKRALSEKISELIPIEPGRISLVPPCAIPRTSSGKTRRFLLKGMIADGALVQLEGRFFAHYLRSQVELLTAVAGPLAERAKAILLRTVAGLRAHAPFARSSLARRLDARLAILCGETLGIPANEVRKETSFSEYALDSLGLIRLQARLGAEVAWIELPELIGIRNLLELRIHLLENRPEAVEEWSRNDQKKLRPFGHRLEPEPRPRETLEPGSDFSFELPPELSQASRGPEASL
jgi:acyl-CoA synthetase (AMP-forming)/AMP-acid ligase II